MRLGVTFSDDVPVAAQQRIAAEAESAGLYSMWANDGYGRDPFLLCQAWAAATERLQVGIGIVQIPTRTPAQVGKAAATLQEASGGRLVLGLGVSQPSALERWHGIERPRPLAAARDALAIIGTVANGETTCHAGEVYSSHDFRLAISPSPPPVPLYLGAMGRKMLALAGGAADGVLLSWEAPAAAADAGAAVRAAAGAAGRPRPEIAAYVRVAIAPDRGSARAALAREIAGYWKYFGRHFIEQDLGPSAAEADAVSRDGGGEEGIAAVLGDDLLLGLGWYGTPDDDVAPFLARYERAGVDQLIARSLPLGDPAASMRRVVDALAAAG